VCELYRLDMPAVDSLELPLSLVGRAVPIRMAISSLPGSGLGHEVPPLVDSRRELPAVTDVELVQLLEGSEYRYVIEGDGVPALLSLEPHEVFFPDDVSGTSGRLRPGLAT